MALALAMMVISAVSATASAEEPTAPGAVGEGVAQDVAEDADAAADAAVPEVGTAGPATPDMSDAEEIAMINEWRLRYGRIYRAEKIFRVVSFLGLGTTGLGIAGLVFAGSACDEDEDPCTLRQVSWGITGAGIGLSVGGLGGWLAYRIIRQRHVDAVLQDGVVRLEPSPTGLTLRF